MGEMPSQSYTLFDIPAPQQTFVHVHPGSDELGRVYRPALAINASPTAFAAALEGLQAPNEIPWSDETRTANADYRAFTDKATDVPGAVNLGEIMVWLRDNLSPDDILCNGAGNYAGWLQSLLSFPQVQHFLRADIRLDGLWRSGRNRHQARSIRSAMWSALPATATS